jgi:hypothetical protein
MTVCLDFINSDTGLIGTPIHSDFSQIRTIVVRCPGIRTSSIRTSAGEPSERLGRTVSTKWGGGGLRKWRRHF